jgi:hypothetical protein
MSFFLYKSPLGKPEVLNYRIPVMFLDGFEFIRELDGWLDVSRLEFGDGDQLVAPLKTYADARREEYPAIAEQLDMLWHAMKDDPSKRLEPFYSSIKRVKDKHPSN